MATDLPETLQYVLVVLVGERWPETDEDEVRRLAQVWRGLGSAFQEALRSADPAAQEIIHRNRGQAIDAFATNWQRFAVHGDRGGEGYLRDAAKACEAMATGLEEFAGDVAGTKAFILIQLEILAVEVALGLAGTAFTFGVSDAIAAAAVAATRVVIQQSLRKLLASAVKKGIRMAGRGVLDAMLDDAMLQGLKLAHGGHGPSFDQFLRAGVAGGIGGVVGGGLGRQADRVGNLPGRLGAELGADVVANAVSTAAVNNGELTGDDLLGGVGRGTANNAAHGIGAGFQGVPGAGPASGNGQADLAAAGGAGPASTDTTGLPNQAGPETDSVTDVPAAERRTGSPGPGTEASPGTDLAAPVTARDGAVGSAFPGGGILEQMGVSRPAEPTPNLAAPGGESRTGLAGTGTGILEHMGVAVPPPAEAAAHRAPVPEPPTPPQQSVLSAAQQGLSPVSAGLVSQQAAPPAPPVHQPPAQPAAQATHAGPVSQPEPATRTGHPGQPYSTSPDRPRPAARSDAAEPTTPARDAGHQGERSTATLAAGSAPESLAAAQSTESRHSGVLDPGLFSGSGPSRTDAEIQAGIEAGNRRAGLRTVDYSQVDMEVFRPGGLSEAPPPDGPERAEAKAATDRLLHDERLFEREPGTELPTSPSQLEDTLAQQAKGATAARLAQRMMSDVGELVRAAADGIRETDHGRSALFDDIGRRLGDPDYLLVPDDPNAPSAGGSVRLGSQETPETREYSLPMDSPEAKRLARELAVYELIRTWAVTSNDSHARALAIQEAARAEFGLGEGHGWEVTPPLRAEVAEQLARHGEVYRDLLRTQYRVTQELLARYGITELALYRGMAFPAAERPAWTDAADGTVIAAPEARPISSWSSDQAVARDFAGRATDHGHSGPLRGVTIASRVPASLVLSLPHSGFGCLRESEFVVMADGGRTRLDSHHVSHQETRQAVTEAEAPVTQGGTPILRRMDDRPDPAVAQLQQLRDAHGDTDVAAARAHQDDIRERVAAGELGTPDAADPYATHLKGQGWQQANAEVGLVMSEDRPRSRVSRLTGDDGPTPVDQARPYNRPGGLRRPLEVDQLDLEIAVPRETDGSYQRAAAPDISWIGRLNDGGPDADAGRATNCVDITLSLYETYVHGRPRVAAPRTLDGIDRRTQLVFGGELGGPARTERITGGTFQELCPSTAGQSPEQARAAVEDAYRTIADSLTRAGHGAFSFVITDWEAGGAHQWVAVNHQGTVHWIDAQTGRFGTDPLYRVPSQLERDFHQVSKVPVRVEALLLDGNADPVHLADRPVGQWSGTAVPSQNREPEGGE